MNQYLLRTYFMAFLSSLTLVGCSTPPEKGLETERVQPEASRVPVGKTSYLSLTNVWPLKLKGTYLQKMKTTVQGEQHTFTLHLILDDQKLEAVAFNDMYGRLYQLTWTPQKTSWVASDAIPESMRPEYIIADFLMTHLSLEDLNASLDNAQAKEENNIRLIESDSKVLRRISYDKPSGDLWEKIVIENPEMGYELNIQTVPLP
jgi:hypothetical protein